MAKPRLGQHFLKDQRYIDKIMKAAELTEQDAVIEVGPGKGVLTKALCKEAGLVLALELDERLANGLHERLGHLPNLEIEKADARYIDWEQLTNRVRERGFRQVKLISNLPYYLATQMVIHALTPVHACERIVVMVQEEVARRMDALPGTKNYSAYSVAVQYYATTSYVITVPAKAFNPPPNVSSAVIRLDKREVPAVQVSNPDEFFFLVHAMFTHRRKTLRKCLQGSKGVPSQHEWDAIIAQSGIDPQRRPETLSMQEMADLFKNKQLEHVKNSEEAV